jgi:uncharacterized lipoprotein YddW (UPF0748 family)
MAALLMSAAMTAAADVYVVDNDGAAPGYQQEGAWKRSSSPGYNGGEYWYILGDDPLSWCSWTPTIQTPGRYEVVAIFRSSTNRSTTVPYTVTHADGSDVVTVSQLGPNEMTEVNLGEFRFEAGTGGSVRMDNSPGGTAAYISDAIRWQLPMDDPPMIQGVAHSPAFPKDTDTVWVTARITDDGTVSGAAVVYSVSSSTGSYETSMADDGQHGDSAAGDSVYGGSIPAQPADAVVTYRVRATDNGSNTVESAQGTYTVNQLAPREYRSIWVDSWNAGILSASQIDDLLATCRANNINTIMAEIRKVGDAYYDSSLEPRATNISGGAGFDPLGYLVEQAHDTSGGKKRVEVHAWFVMHRIATSTSLPSGHVLLAHPEYMMLDSTGNEYGGSNRYLDPGHPGTVDHNVAVIVDCVKKYDIDGVNLDYIRYPEYSGEWGYNASSVSRFNALHGLSGQPSGSDPRWDAWRRECVALEVKKIYVKMLQEKWGLKLTADTVNWGYSYSEGSYPSSSAYAGVFQDWVGWLEDGILDYNALMDYSTSTSRFLGWMNLSLAHDAKRGSIIGVGAYLQSSVQASVNQMLSVRAAGAAGINIYDWGSEVNAASESRAEFYQQVKAQVFQEWADPPIAPWKSNPTWGVIEGTVTAGGVPVDHATVEIEGLASSATPSDGNGWYGILEVSPGIHRLRASKAGYPEAIVVASLPGPGQVITVDIDLLQSNPGVWLLY